jgi:hypothetical protein
MEVCVLTARTPQTILHNAILREHGDIWKEQSC